MVNFNNIKIAIDTYIKTNGSQEITGDVLNSVLNGMIESVDVALTDAVKTILDGVSSDFDTLKEIAAYIDTDKKQYTDLLSTLSVINDLITSLGVTIQSLSKQVQELSARVAALEGDDKTSNIIGTAKVGYALLG